MIIYDYPVLREGTCFSGIVDKAGEGRDFFSAYADPWNYGKRITAADAVYYPAVDDMPYSCLDLRRDRMDIRFVTSEDKPFWYGLDKHLSEAEFDKKVRDRQGYVLLVDGEPAGLLRYNLFWDNTPFCTLISVQERHRKQGFGRFLMERWERDMRALGYGMVLTSTQVDEEAQRFYRKLGYKDCGGLTVDVPGYEQPMELFMVKRL